MIDAPPDGYEDHPPDGYEEQPSQLATNISTMARPILEGGGAIVGSMAGGGPETPVGWGGAALGYAGGKAASDLLDRKLGLKAPIQNLPEAMKESAQDIQSGAEMGTANLLINPALRGMGRLALKGASAYFGPSEQAISARLSNPALAESSFPKTGEELAGNLNKLQTNLNDIEDKVWGSLLKLKAEPKSVLLGMINQIKGQYNVTGGPVVGEARKSAIDALSNLADDIKSYKQKGITPGTESMFDQKQLRQIIQSVSEDINWSDTSATSKNEALTAFRHNLSEYLKNSNPQYADLIQQSADRTALLNNAEKTFSLKKVAGEFQPSDATMGKLQSLLKPNNVQSQQVAEQVKNLTGMDLQQAVQNSRYAGEFEKTATQGSRRAVMAGATGAALGSIFGHSTEGAAIGAAAGGYLDKYASQNLGSALDLINRLGITPSINPIASLGLLAAMAGKEQGQ